MFVNLGANGRRGFARLTASDTIIRPANASLITHIGSTACTFFFTCSEPNVAHHLKRRCPCEDPEMQTFAASQTTSLQISIVLGSLLILIVHAYKSYNSSYLHIQI